MRPNRINPFKIYIVAITLLAIISLAVAPAESGWDGRAQTAQPKSPVLVWKHGTTREYALNIIKNNIDRLGYARYVRWDGYEARSYIVRFFIKVLDVSGRVGDEVIVIDKCRGRGAADVLIRCRELLQKAFPGGEVLQ